MPKRTDIRTILIIGSGPIVIGQGCEFDYSGTQACRALREEGYRVVLVNSNPATIMTDPEFADRTYVEPLTIECLTAIIAKERPDVLLPTLGGQTALNLAMGLHEQGVLAQYNVGLIGASIQAIKTAEDRQCFKDTMTQLGLQVPESATVTTLDDAIALLPRIGLPAIIRPAFTLGGAGGGIARTRAEFDALVAWGLQQSPVQQILVEASVLGWKEFELEVMRDRNDNVVIICSIENFDPMGVHTGDSITVAPAQTLTDKEYQRMRDAAAQIIRAVGVETGGANIQFAVSPVDGTLCVVEMNPRVSRSSALASKATGYPIAKIAAKLAIGYTLDELPNDITQETKASFEPTIDYVVTKIPRFNFEKFPQSTRQLTTQMKSIGEVMAIGRTFPESLGKAIRSLEIGAVGLSELSTPGDTTEWVERLRTLLEDPTPERLWWIAEGFRRGVDIEEMFRATQVDRWFLAQIQRVIAMEQRLRAGGLQSDVLVQAKCCGFSDARIAEICGESEEKIRATRTAAGIFPQYGMVDTCAAEFAAQTPYLYSTYDGAAREPAYGVLAPEAAPSTRRKIVILGSGPNRIGQGIEFDYCCVQAALALREAGVEAIMINCNPETVSTDYDIADRLYFEPLTFEDVTAILDREQPEGVIIQFGGQTPLKLAQPLAAAGYRILGTPPDAIDRAEDRARFRDLIEKLSLTQPPSGIASSRDAARAIAQRLGYPVLVRPSYVLGGRAMKIIADDENLERYLREAALATTEQPVLIDRFLNDAIEVDVDCLSDGRDVAVVGIMQHVEEAGVHSGDSSCCLPPYSLTSTLIQRIESQAMALARELGVVGLMNVQFAVQGDTLYILEVNPRASRTVPFVAKARGFSVSRLATRCMLGERLADILPPLHTPTHFSVKTPVFPFVKFPGADTLLGPEMRSTGEVMGMDTTFGGAFLRAQQAAGNALPSTGTVFVSVRDADKPVLLPIARGLCDAGFALVATHGTAQFLAQHGLMVGRVKKVAEGSPHVVDALRAAQYQLVINTTENRATVISDSFSIRRTTLECGIPYFTTLAAAAAAVEAITLARSGPLMVRSLQEWHNSGDR